jgi:glycerol-1-phosphate dehydrogenase [NAD(P)+]
LSGAAADRIELRDGTRPCACGETHRVAIEAIVVGDDAIERLADHAARERWDTALLVADANTEEALGERLRRTLRAGGVGVRTHRFAERSGLSASPRAAEAVRAQLGADTVPLSVGSGTLTDIVRHAAHTAGRDFVSVPTAASMDGYASSIAAMQVDGVKVTYPARVPRAIFADPRVAAAAPRELARSGIGDLLAKATARTDWLAAHLLYGEPYCPAVAGRVAEPMRFAAAHVAELLDGEPGAVRGLLLGLLQSGVAMAMVGSSRPASGCEHHASHFWDLLASRGRRPHHPHGLQVGYATHFAMRLQRFAFAGGVAAPVAPLAHEPLDAAARAWLGDPTPEIVAAVADKRRLTAPPPPPSWPASAEDWEGVQVALAPALAPFADVERALVAAEIPDAPGFLGLDADTLRATFHYATRLRARYTAVDFLEGQGALEAALDAALATSASARVSG